MNLTPSSADRDVDEVFARYDDEAVQDELTANLSARVTEIARTQNELIEVVAQMMSDREAPRPVLPGVDDLAPWTRDAARTAAEWEQLVDWFDLMIDAHAITEIPACWLAHESLVLEIEAIRIAWIGAQLSLKDAPNSAVAHWYSYYWTPLRHRLATWPQCRVTHQPDPQPAHTDRQYLPLPPSLIDQEPGTHS